MLVLKIFRILDIIKRRHTNSCFLDMASLTNIMSRERQRYERIKFDHFKRKRIKDANKLPITLLKG